MGDDARQRIGWAEGTRRLARALGTEPRSVGAYAVEKLIAVREQPPPYRPDPDWESRFHALLGAPWPCPESLACNRSWEAARRRVESAGARLGRHTYGAYSDGDRALTRAAWCAVRHLRPSTVLETGVAHGVSTRVILDALDANADSSATLYSVDQPHLFHPELHRLTAVAVPPEQRIGGRWKYLPGSSRRRLPPLLRGLGAVDLFLHDSLHTERNTRFEMTRVAAALRPGGLMVIDDISTHRAFPRFTAAHPEFTALVAASEDGEGLFGIAVRPR
ncbi:class I SAM-dependent methyltransferase [Phaeacidiphilus oryzae]|uniref:class I SAM-dependent methyltransferase n=1 Tax=Phaeacidiphilus oryzae TaxID=348818 RepID=UPI000B26DAC2|nr:class I SAM-dependent methyltransferase [Phaeacidiphilus oryzae]